jgi:hypothetical protein
LIIVSIILPIAHAVAVAGVRDGIRGQIHVLGAAGDHDVGIAAHDHAGRFVDAVKAGAAQHVDRDGGHFHGQAGLQGRLTGHVLAAAGLDDTAHVDLIDLLGLHIGAAQRLLDDDGAQICGRGRLQAAAELAHGGTACGCDNNFLHEICPPVSMFFS